MQSRVALERHSPACKVVHVRCRAHEQGDDGSLARRLCAQLCGYDVWASLKYIIPLLGQAAAGQAAAGQAAAGQAAAAGGQAAGEPGQAAGGGWSKHNDYGRQQEGSFRSSSAPQRHAGSSPRLPSPISPSFIRRDAARDAQLDAEIDAELRLVCAMHGRCGLQGGEAAFDFNDLAHEAAATPRASNRASSNRASSNRASNTESEKSDKEGDRDSSPGSPRSPSRRGSRGGGQRAASEEVEADGGYDDDDDEAPEVGPRLALLIDDLHLADQHSCKLLQKLAASSAARPGPLLLIVASRDERASLSKEGNGIDGFARAMGSNALPEQRISDGRRLVHTLASQPSSLRVQPQPLSNPDPDPDSSLNP